MNYGSKKLLDSTQNELPAGGYACEIFAVDESPATVYLYIYNGQNRQIIEEAHSRYGTLGGSITFCNDSPQFAHFITIVEQSNPDFRYNGENLEELEFSEIGIVIQKPKYLDKDGIMSLDTDSVRFTTVADIYNGNDTAPAMKRFADSV